MTKADAKVLGYSLLATAHYADWKIQWSPAAPSECWYKSKKLMMWEGLLGRPWWYIKEAFIHEIAHIEGLGEWERGGHGPAFFTRYGQLLVRLAHVEVKEER